jgi:galactonate dehydratase
MRITDVQVLRTATPAPADTNWTFVRIETDEGIHGWGEASLQYKDDALVAELEAFGRFLEGEDPRRIDHIWTSLHRRVTWSGGAVTMSAISAIDLALWDVKARALGVPVYELLGGRCHETIPLYANGWQGDAETPEEYADRARDVVDRGYSCLKFYPFAGEQVVTPERIDRGVALVSAVRDAVGPQVEVAVDVRTRLNVWSARRVARRLEPFDVAWLEEPVLNDNPEAMAELARTLRVPVATGEQLFTRWEFRALLEQNAVGIVQPDICHAGGISELRKIASMAETYYVTVAPHNSNGPISTLASLHLDTSIPNSFRQEVFLNYLDRYDELLTDSIGIEDGTCTPPDGPGWGADLREEALARHPPVEYTPVTSEPYQEF